MIPFYLLAAAMGYLLGSIPTGYVICRLVSGVDVRTVGSGRTGGTNVLRSAGWVPAIITVVGDTAKGYLAVVLAQMLTGSPLAGVIAGLAVVLGHNHSIFLGGMGGAGSMTNVGVLLAFSPTIALICVVVSVIPLIVSRFASLGSVSLAILTPLLLWAGSRWGQLPTEYIIYGILSALMTLYELRANIVRLVKGRERKIGESPKLDTASVE